jgi:branched-chain amino acid transport system ATP-binding protein
MTVKSNEIISVKDLHVYYGAIHAIKGISFQVFEGEIVSLIGSNGAGKTSTLRALSGILPSQGEILFSGESLGGIPSYQRVSLGMAQSPEGRGAFTNLTVLENLQMGGYCLKNKTHLEEGIQSAFQRFPILKERRNQEAGTLSGGEQQMLAIARALMSRPRALLLDEPSLGLAPLIVAQIFEIIQSLNAQGMTILLVEQNAHMALKISHRAYVLETGLITMTGTGHDLSRNPEIRKAYLGH